MERAISYCEAEDFDNVFLWTFEGLESAQYLYREYGFTLTEEEISDDWDEKLPIRSSKCALNKAGELMTEL